MKEFTTIDEQINILKERNLLFHDVEKAKRNLMQYGYYEIINGYKDCLLEDVSSEIFKSGSTFEHLFALYEFDKNIKNEIFNACLEFEQVLKAAMSYVIAEQFGVTEEKYLNKKNYKSGKPKMVKGKKVYPIDEMIFKFNKISQDDIEPFSHYREKHSHVPPWILFKGASFGNMKYFYQLQKSNIKNEIVSIIFDMPVELIELEENQHIKDFFSDFLNLCYQFRNRTGHSGRTFNYRPKKCKVRYSKLLHKKIGISEEYYRLGYGVNDLFTLTNCFRYLSTFSVFIGAKVGIELSLKRLVDLYPLDRDFIIKSIGVPDNVNLEDRHKIFSLN